MRSLDALELGHRMRGYFQASILFIMRLYGARELVEKNKADGFKMRGGALADQSPSAVSRDSILSGLPTAAGTA